MKAHPRNMIVERMRSDGGKKGARLDLAEEPPGRPPDTLFRDVALRPVSLAAAYRFRAERPAFHLTPKSPSLPGRAQQSTTWPAGSARASC